MATKAAKQDTYIWEGKDSRGNKAQGETIGKSVALVKADLRRQGVNPTKVRKNLSLSLVVAVKPKSFLQILQFLHASSQP